jgi:hypothetical protein
VLRHAPLVSNEWQRRLVQGERVLVDLSAPTCGSIPQPLVCGGKYSYKVVERGVAWCGTARQIGSTEALADPCKSDPDNSVIVLAGAPFSFNESGEVFFDGRPVGHLEKAPPPNEWQSRFMRGEKILTAFSRDGCGIVPRALACPGKYVVKLTEMEGRWCETSHQLGSTGASGIRCNADPDDSIFTVLGAPFAFTAGGEVFYDRRPVGHLELPGPADQ